jgi:hypothetical protein
MPAETRPNNHQPPDPNAIVFDCVVFKPPKPTTPLSLGVPCGLAGTTLILIRAGTWLSTWAPTFAEARMPEPKQPGIWAWADGGTVPGIDNVTGRFDAIIWRGSWERLSPDQEHALARSGEPPWPSS